MVTSWRALDSDKYKPGAFYVDMKWVPTNSIKYEFAQTQLLSSDQRHPFSNVLRNRCFEKLRTYHRKIPVPECFYLKTFQPYSLILCRKSALWMLLWNFCSVTQTCRAHSRAPDPVSYIIICSLQIR